ncbi:MAG: DNA polymerase III, partial [Microgenomates group bacterium]
MENQFSNKTVAKILRNIAAVYLLTGENQFKVIAYQKAADVIESLSREIKDIWLEGKIDTIPGIGKNLKEHLDEFFKNGKSAHFENILKKIPRSVFILMELPGVGPKKAFQLVNKLKLFNEKTVIDDLKKACLEDKVAQLDNFGFKSQEDIIKAIELYRKKSTQHERMPLPYAFEIASDIAKYLKKMPEIERVDLLGSLRRYQATIGDIDIAVSLKSKKPDTSVYKKIINYFVNYPKKIKIDNAGEKKASIIVEPYVRIDLRIEEKKGYGAMLQYFTGNKAHNIQLREFALKKGYSLSEYGIKDFKTNKLYQFEDEASFYNFLGLQYIPPELREGKDEIEKAQKNEIPKLVELKDIKGDLHIHSSFDVQPSHDLGVDDFLTLMRKANQLNYEYIGFSDHNPKNSLPEDEIINILRNRYNFVQKKLSKKLQRSNYFIGIEADILPDGSIPIPKEGLKYIDYLIVAVHSVFNMDNKLMTKRVLKALSYQKVKILAHPTGRLLGKRDGFELEWEKIFEVCKKNNIALEVNAWPLRLDLPDILIKEATDKDVKLIINTDSHQVDQMDLIFYGVMMARRGWATKEDV